MHKANVVSPLVKAGTFVLSLVLNAFYMFMCLLYAAANGAAWQNEWLLHSICFILFMLLLEDTFEAIMIGFVIPVQCLQQIRALKGELKSRLDSAARPRSVLPSTSSSSVVSVTAVRGMRRNRVHKLPDPREGRNGTN
jgi:hypothetical protein